jgi:ribosomal protein L7/L12
VKTNLPAHQHAVLEELVEAVYASTSTEDLAMNLRAATGYVEQCLLLGLAEPTYFVFEDHGPKKINVIKALRKQWSVLGLKLAKTLSEQGPWIIGRSNDHRARLAADALREVGAFITERSREGCTEVEVTFK